MKQVFQLFLIVLMLLLQLLLHFVLFLNHMILYKYLYNQQVQQLFLLYPKQQFLYLLVQVLELFVKLNI